MTTAIDGEKAFDKNSAHLHCKCPRECKTEEASLNTIRAMFYVL